MNCVKQKHAFVQAICIPVILFVTLCSGCSTLSSLGIPTGMPNNRLLKRAKEISEAPGQSFLIQKELALSPLETYVIEIGDTVSVEAVSFEATIRLPGDQIVKPDGNISLGEFGSYQANGKTVEQMELEVQTQIDDRLRSKMEIDFAKREARSSSANSDSADAGVVEGSLTIESHNDDDAQCRKAREEFEQNLDEMLKQNRVSVRVTNWESKKIYVLGEVNSPGSFQFIGNETVLDAIIEAGGLANKANRHGIIVSRPSSCGQCRTVMKICYDQIVQLGDASTNYQLLPGDRVFVPSMTFLDDLKRTFNPLGNQHCPRCSGCDVGCQLPTGCE